jgi:hypothetical protein
MLDCVGVELEMLIVNLSALQEAGSASSLRSLFWKKTLVQHPPSFGDYRPNDYNPGRGVCIKLLTLKESGPTGQGSEWRRTAPKLS